jgi:hypothetical protein
MGFILIFDFTKKSPLTRKKRFFMRVKLSCLVLLTLFLAAPFAAKKSEKIPIYADPKTGKTLYYENARVDSITYLAMPEFRTGNTIWGAVAITLDQKVIVGVANHTNNTGVFMFDTKKRNMEYIGDLTSLGNLIPGMMDQSKIHAYIYQNHHDKLVYMGGDAGNQLSENLFGHPDGYYGGIWFSLNTDTKEVRNLGLAIPWKSVKGMVMDQKYDRIFYITDPGNRFMYYDIKTGVNRDLGRYNGFHACRQLLADKWGNGYTIGHYGELIKYEVKTDKVIQTSVILPFDGFVPIYALAQGITAHVHNEDGTIYIATSFGSICRFYPQELGEGRIEHLGRTCEPSDFKNPDFKDPLQSSCLGKGKNGKLYYTIGGHKKYLSRDHPGLVFVFEFDPKTRKREVIGYVDHRRIGECTGSNVIDDRGYLYFGGHGQSLPDEMKKKNRDVERKAFLVTFHPDTVKTYFKGRRKGMKKW